MATGPASAGSTHRQITLKLLTSAALLALLPACTPSFIKGSAKAPSLNLAEKSAEPLSPLNPLHKATAYWAEEHRKRPNDPTAALNYAKNLKAVGSKPLALSVLYRAHSQHPENKEIASEYGRLVLEEGKIQLALRILKQAELPKGRTDWRVMSAQGTAYAKLGDHAKAQSYFAAALNKKPDSASLRNNLALSYAMSGSPDKAETLLRETIDGGYDTPRVRQNLALVLGLQGKFKQSQQLASVDLPKKEVESNVSYLRGMVHTKALAHNELAAQAKVASAPQAQAAPMTVASAPAAQRAPAIAPRELSSQTLPLPWQTRTSAASSAPVVRTAQAVPLPTQKPARPGSRTAPAPKPSHGQATPASTAEAKPAPLPWQPGAASSQDRKVAVASWQTRVIAEAEMPRQPKRIFKPFPGAN